MNHLVQVTTGLFGLLMRLFPPAFRQDYGEELQGVFYSLATDSVEKNGTWGLVKVCWNEIRDLPGNLLKEHLDSLQKKFMPDRHHRKVSPWRAAGAGAFGFGMGFAVQILYRWMSNPANDLMLRNKTLGLFQETVLFGVASALGWFMIGRALFPPSQTGRLARSGLLFGALGGWLATMFVSNSMMNLLAHPHSGASSGVLIQMMGALIYGACFGAPVALEAGYRERSLFLMISTAACFGMGQFISDVAFRLYYMVPIAFEWRMLYWGIPLAGAAAVDGLVGGGLLGWVVSREKPRQLDRAMSKPKEKNPLSTLEGNRLMIDYPVPGK
jgi:hypothetical protein